MGNEARSRNIERKPASAILLAGGFSARMGRDKAELPFGGTTMLLRQVEKLRSLGLEDILVVGRDGSAEGIRWVPDIYPHRGPLSGIHAGLLAAREGRALVVAVDMPLVPESLLAELLEAHREGVTLCTLDGRRLPLPGVYDKSLAPACETILRGEDTSLRRLFRETRIREVSFSGDGALLANCNTPEEYARLTAGR